MTVIIIDILLLPVIPLLQKHANLGIISLRCGVIRCVGADSTCAGTKELALPSTAVVLFSVCIIPYMHAYIKLLNYTIFPLQFRLFCMHAYTLDLCYTSFEDVTYMALTNAQQKANQKYREKFVYLQTRTTDDYRNLIYKHIEETGESLNSFILRAIAETIERDSSK